MCDYIIHKLVDVLRIEKFIVLKRIARVDYKRSPDQIQEAHSRAHDKKAGVISLIFDTIETEVSSQTKSCVSTEELFRLLGVAWVARLKALSKPQVDSFAERIGLDEDTVLDPAEDEDDPKAFLTVHIIHKLDLLRIEKFIVLKRIAREDHKLSADQINEAHSRAHDKKAGVISLIFDTIETEVSSLVEVGARSAPVSDELRSSLRTEQFAALKKSARDYNLSADQIKKAHSGAADKKAAVASLILDTMATEVGSSVGAGSRSAPVSAELCSSQTPAPESKAVSAIGNRNVVHGPESETLLRLQRKLEQQRLAQKARTVTPAQDDAAKEVDRSSSEKKAAAKRAKKKRQKQRKRAEAATGATKSDAVLDIEEVATSPWSSPVLEIEEAPDLGYDPRTEGIPD